MGLLQAHHGRGRRYHAPRTTNCDRPGASWARMGDKQWGAVMGAGGRGGEEGEGIEWRCWRHWLPTSTRHVRPLVLWVPWPSADRCVFLTPSPPPLPTLRACSGLWRNYRSRGAANEHALPRQHVYTGLTRVFSLFLNWLVFLNASPRGTFAFSRALYGKKKFSCHILRLGADASVNHPARWRRNLHTTPGHGASPSHTSQRKA